MSRSFRVFRAKKISPRFEQVRQTVWCLSPGIFSANVIFNFFCLASLARKEITISNFPSRERMTFPLFEVALVQNYQFFLRFLTIFHPKASGIDWSKTQKYAKFELRGERHLRSPLCKLFGNFSFCYARHDFHVFSLWAQKKWEQLCLFGRRFCCNFGVQTALKTQIFLLSD